MAEPSANTGADPDLSMEEILQSIRSIIAEDGDTGKPAATSKPLTEEGPQGSEVLELTEMVNEDGTPLASPPIETPEPDTLELDSPLPEEPAEDVLSKIDALTPPAPQAAPPPPPMPEPVAAEPVAMDEAPAAIEIPSPSLPPSSPVEPSPMPKDSLISDETAAVSAAALKKLAQQKDEADQAMVTSIPLRSGETVEDLVIEALKPMLKEWLNMNLAGIVQRIVEKEVRRLASGL